MPKTSYSRNAGPIDAPILAVWEATPSKPIRIRIQPQIYSPNYGRSGGYVAWAGVYWSIEVADPAEAAQLREAVALFFAQVGAAGIGKVVEALAGIDRTAAEAVESAACSG